MKKFRKSKKKEKATVVKKIMITYYCGYLEKEVTMDWINGIGIECGLVERIFISDNNCKCENKHILYVGKNA